MWENASPQDHWIPWCEATVVVRPGSVGRTFYARKDGYRLNSAELLSIVGDRMVEAVQERIPGYTAKNMAKDLTDLRKILKVQVSE